MTRRIVHRLAEGTTAGSLCGLRACPPGRAVASMAVVTCRTCLRLALDLVDGVEQLEHVLRSDLSTHALNIRALALRLYARGVRVQKEI